MHETARLGSGHWLRGARCVGLDCRKALPRADKGGRSSSLDPWRGTNPPCCAILLLLLHLHSVLTRPSSTHTTWLPSSVSALAYSTSGRLCSRLGRWGGAEALKQVQLAGTGLPGRTQKQVSFPPNLPTLQTLAQLSCPTHTYPTQLS